MAEYDYSFSVMEDWMPSSPSPRTFFTKMMNHEDNSKPISELLVDVKTSGETSIRDSAQTDHLLTGVVYEQTSSLHGGLSQRIAARAGFNAPKLNTECIRPADFSMNPSGRSPYMAISPGFSPTILLESPVFLSNSLVQPSPTTGKLFSAPSDGRHTLPSDRPEKNKDDVFEDIDLSSFTFNPVSKSCPSFFLEATSKEQIMPSAFAQQSFPSIEVSVESKHSVHSQSLEAMAPKEENESFPTQFSLSSAEKDLGNDINPTDQRVFDTVSDNKELSPPLGDRLNEEYQGRYKEKIPSEDGYNWRKYGEEQIKGSEHLWSYYNCTYPNCPVKKKVERSHEGYIIAMKYKGAHNHAKPVPKTVGEGSGNSEVTSSASAGFQHENPSLTLQAQFGFDVSSTFSNDEDGDDRATHGSNSLGCEAEGDDEPESKRRKLEANATEMIGATRAIREPRIVVQTTSDVDIIDDGYRWRKYGQKVVKGNPNPRSYYKCTSPGCNVRKHVERASHDLKSVVTTYEGKHNHEVPAARNSSHSNSTSSNPQSSSLVQTKPLRFQSGLAATRPEMFPSLSPFALRQQLGFPMGFSFGMTQPGLANLLTASDARLPGLPMNQLPNYVLPTGEPKVEPVSEPASFNRSNGSSIYQEIMKRLALGPQM